MHLTLHYPIDAHCSQKKPDNFDKTFVKSADGYANYQNFTILKGRICQYHY